MALCGARSAVLRLQTVKHAPKISFLSVTAPPSAASFTTTVAAQSTTFHEKDRKSGYNTTVDTTNWETTKHGFRMIGVEYKKWKKEMADKFTLADFEIIQHGSYTVVAQFDNEDTVNEWVVSADSDHNEGKSSATFQMSEHNYGLFTGTINTTVPKDGLVKRAGYCSIRSPSRMKSFKRKIAYDFFADYTHLVVRYRGDGRPYLVNIKLQHDLDVLWQDLYSYPLYTRGGPYWQIAKIPFSKFFLGYKGRIQDKQFRIPLEKVANIGFTCSDQNSGPFLLELDYIGLIYDHSHKEKFAYEMYELPVGVANC